MILVTGASGRLGRPLVEALVMQGEQVRILDRNGAYVEGAEVIEGDIRDPDTVKRAAEGADTIYHLAAIVDYQHVPRNVMYDVNVNGTICMLENSSPRRFIYQSTTSVYGHRMAENPADEETRCRPDTYYGETKAVAEREVTAKAGIVLRAPVIYGKGFNEGYDFVCSQIEKGSMRLIGSGDNRIQWVHINDVVQGLLLAKDNGKPGSTYLVAGGEQKTQKELFALLAKNLGVPAPERSMPVALAKVLAYYSVIRARLSGKRPKLIPEYVDRIASDRRFDISKARRELLYEPKVGYEMGAKEIVDGYTARKTDSAVREKTGAK